MTWFDYLILSLWFLGVVAAVAQVGTVVKRTKETAVVTVVINLLLIAGLLWTRGVF